MSRSIDIPYPEWYNNTNGIRTSKEIDGVLHTYQLDGTKILRETWGNNTLVPLYDNEDGVCGILYNNVPYYFIKNLQGDVIAIVDKDAQTVARYSYDAWGVCTVTQDSVGIATVNPFRYRSYYYDEEIELYYLQSRYYDASVSKFINADDEYIFNTYCYGIGVFCFYNYCNNDPINRKDSFGNWFITAIKAFVAATKTVHDVVSGTVKSFVTSSIKGYTALQTTLSVLINAGIAVVKNVFLFLIDRYLSFAKKVLNKLVEGISAFLSEMGDQWISTGDFNRINWLRCLKVGFRGIAFSFVDAGLGRWQETVLTKLTSGLKDAKFTCDVIYEIYVVLFVDLPQNVINALI